MAHYPMMNRPVIIWMVLASALLASTAEATEEMTANLDQPVLVESEELKDPQPQADADGSQGSRVATGAALVLQTHIDDAGADIGLYGGDPSVAFLTYVSVRLTPVVATETRYFCGVKQQEGVAAARQKTNALARKRASRKINEKIDSGELSGPNMAPSQLTPEQVNEETGWEEGLDASCLFSGPSVYLGGIVPYSANITGPSGNFSRAIKIGLSAGLQWELYQGIGVTAGWSVLFAEFERGEKKKRIRALSGPTVGFSYTLDIIKLVAGKL